MNVSSDELCGNNSSLDVGTLGSYIGYFTTDYLEIAIYIVCLVVGGPLNLYAFANAINSLVNHKTARFNRLLILRINLNIADLLTMFVYTLTQIVWMSTFQWYGGDILCRLCKFFYTFSFYLNSFIVVSIALDRLYTTYHLSEFKAASALSNVRIMIIVAWTAAIILSLPQVFIFRLFVVEDPHFEQCAPIWTIYHYYVQQKTLYNISISDEIIAYGDSVAVWEWLYNWLHLLTIFWIPALIIVLSYIGILSRLQKNISGHAMKQGSIRALRQNQHASDTNIRRGPPLCSNPDDHGLPITAYANGGTALTRPVVYRPSNTGDGANGNRGSIHSTNEAEQKLTRSVSCDQLPPILPVDRMSMVHRLAERLSGVPWQQANYRYYGQLAASTMSRAKRKTMQKAAMILIAYFTFWTPYNLLTLVNMVSPQSEKELTTVTLAFLNSLIVVNAIVNPLIYGVFERRNN
uniref:G-protein coupled receptors family 1 profile domain-containing protein n=1 Tax=Plectus sambesii TaxID=2011161 RepID=A0A914WH21_9BILA